MSDRVTAAAADGATGALGRLRRAYENRLEAALAHHAAGGGVVGHIGAGLPIEVLMATGHMPLAIAPLPDRPTPLADPWLNPTFNPQLRVTLDQLLSGELTFLELAVYVSQSSPDSHLYQAAKVIMAQGHAPKMPLLHHFSLLGHRHPSSYEYGLQQTHALARRLRTISGEAATDDRLEGAIEVTNRNRGLLRRLNERRRAGRLSGVEGLTVAGAGRFMHPGVFGDALSDYLAGEPGPATTKPRLLVMSASRLSDTLLHEALEEADCVVTAEDDIWGSRAATPDIVAGGTPLESIFRHYHLTTPNRTIYPATDRLSWMYAEGPSDDVDGVVFYMPPSDRSMGWDYPRLKDFLDEKKKPSMVLRCDATTPEGRARVVSTTRYFIENSL
jgi:benzoyl-CoA reductase/2-hydroxyglutaryl-CoA dehydratase subunit BcrC/BadD/HgdB